MPFISENVKMPVGIVNKIKPSIKLRMWRFQEVQTLKTEKPEKEYDDSKRARVIQKYAEKIITSKSPFDSRGFYIIDLKNVLYKVRLWKESCPRIQPFYAVKCNDDPLVMASLACHGVNFDCASMQEIKKVLAVGVDPSRIVYAHPVKTIPYLQFARKVGVTRMTFDSLDELYKVRQHYPAAQLIVRLKVDDGGCVFKLSKKFGATESTAKYLMEAAKQMELTVCGVSFHVGCSKKYSSIFTNAIQSARRLFNYGEEIGFNMKVLDIGGGFPGYRGCEQEYAELATAINTAIDELFPAHNNYEIISEPGTFFVASAFTLYSRIIGKKVFDLKNSGIFLRDGIHTGLNEQVEENEMGDSCYDSAESDASDSESETAPASLNKCNRRRPVTSQEGDLAEQTATDRRCEYYINDSVYMSFNMSFFNEDVIQPELAYPKKRTDGVRVASSIWGNTCDGVDKVKTSCLLPELCTGDWLTFNSLGAYSVVLETPFNGMDAPERFYVR